MSVIYLGVPLCFSQGEASVLTAFTLMKIFFMELYRNVRNFFTNMFYQHLNNEEFDFSKVHALVHTTNTCHMLYNFSMTGIGQKVGTQKQP